jgi:lysozyme family protein
MKANFGACVAHVFLSEGGYVDHPNDPGGATNMGITIKTLAAYRGRKVTKAEVKALTKSEAAEIYRKNYWDAVSGDYLPRGLDLVAFDGAVNSGPARGAEWLQQALGVAPDGRIGPKTIAAANSTYAPAAIARNIAIRRTFMKSIRDKKTKALLWDTFGRGWNNRLLALEKAALAMADDASLTAKPYAPTPAPQSNVGLWTSIAAAAVAGAAALSGAFCKLPLIAAIFSTCGG